MAESRGNSFSYGWGILSARRVVRHRPLWADNSYASNQSYILLYIFFQGFCATTKKLIWGSSNIIFTAEIFLIHELFQMSFSLHQWTFRLTVKYCFPYPIDKNFSILYFWSLEYTAFILSYTDQKHYHCKGPVILQR